MTDERDLLDVDNLRTVKDAAAWMRGADKECRETAKHVTNLEQAAYLRGRAHAFGMAAGLLESAIREDEV